MIGSLHPGYVVLLQPQLVSEQFLHEPCTLQPLVQTIQSNGLHIHNKAFHVRPIIC